MLLKASMYIYIVYTVIPMVNFRQSTFSKSVNIRQAEYLRTTFGGTEDWI